LRVVARTAIACARGSVPLVSSVLMGFYSPVCGQPRIYACDGTTPARWHATLIHVRRDARVTQGDLTSLPQVALLCSEYRGRAVAL
jgi:hypothetical protein